jgi:Ca2+-binding RTX toxin-like protein
LLSTPIHADFIQCAIGSACLGTNDADVFLASIDGNIITAFDGNDAAFGSIGSDVVTGMQGNDVLFGGPGNDVLLGGFGNDVLVPGPDMIPEQIQLATGQEDDDIINVLVGEITGCLVVDDNGGVDTLNLIGFGPFSISAPFRLPADTGAGVLIVIDPITGGLIVIHINTMNDLGIEKINGALSTSATLEAVPAQCAE